MASRGDCRQQTLRDVAEEIVALLGDGIVLVAVDGVDGAGKTVFADELARVLQACHVAVLRASIDGFHNPPSIRYARGRASPEGFYLDSYDYDAVRRLLLDPLGRHGDRRIVLAVYDVFDEQPVAHAVELAPMAGGARARWDLPAPRGTAGVLGLLDFPRGRLLCVGSARRSPRTRQSRSQCRRESTLRRGSASVLSLDPPP